MVRRRTVDLLPEIFQTSTNKQFLAATLDQLVQEPNIIRTQGYVGRRVGPGVNPSDNYVVESTPTRIDYQLEPGVVFFEPDTATARDAITYPGIIDALKLQGADVTRQDRLFQSQYYSWDPFCDLDKFSNYSQYYWLPGGPDSVDVSSTVYPLTDSFVVTRNNTSYQFSGQAGTNPVLTLVRGGSYTFDLQQTGNPFWIQAAPGISGTMPNTPNISSRDVLGVINNGEDNGTVTFNVPDKDAQNFFYTLTDIGSVDLITDLKFNEINNIYVNEFLAAHPEGIDGITNLSNRTVIFTNITQDAQDGGWQTTTQFDPLEQLPSNNGLIGSYDTTSFDQTTDVPESLRYTIWRIQYVLDNQGQPYMQLSSIRPVPNLSKFQILFGTRWANTSWYKNASGFFQKIPLLTAVLDDLWYQDGTNPDIFGQIKIIDQADDLPIDLSIDDIVGAKTYTSPNGVVFTNGLKVQFRGPVNIPQFQNQEYYVEGVGTGPGIASRVGFVDGEAYYGPFHIYDNRRMTGAVHNEDEFQQYIYETLAESILNPGAGGPDGAPLPSQGVLGAAFGNGIRLVPVADLITPETYTKSETIPYDSTAYDATPYDASLNAPEVPDYLTINRSSRDRNPWSRSNRWFHKDVIQASADYNNQIPIFDNNRRAKRPIIEFRADMDLWNFGTQAKVPVDVIDFTTRDALSTVNGQLGFGTDGFTLINGSRIIFAADEDADVRNRIYQVQFIDPDNSGNKIIDLVTIENGEALINQTVLCVSGNTLQGKSFWFDGAEWITAQQKTGVNQPPLFDVYDINGNSLGNSLVYPSTTFAGSKLFGYALGGTQISDEVLGFSLKFLNINNVGDIVFENYLYTDTFLYVVDSVSQTENISIGYARQYLDRTLFSSLIGWQSAAAENRSRQVFRFTYDGTDLILDVPIDEDSVYAPLQIFQGTQFVDPTTYTYVINSDGTTTVTFATEPDVGTLIEVQAISDVPSRVAYYQVPLNLENNPLNENSDAFTLGTIRQHYESIGQNLRNIVGPINGANNTRDLGDILRYGDNIVQHSSPLALSGPFLRERQLEVVAAIQFNSREYEKYKARLMDLAGKGDYINNTPTQILDTIMAEISLGRDSNSPFYWSDMVPNGQNYVETTYVFTQISTNTFDTTQVYDYTSSNYQGLSVYLNGSILTRGYDYVVNPDSSTFTINLTLSLGDEITIREYPATYGSYVPNTPTKMGLYSAFRPEMFLDASYLEPTMVIRGHDGSITVAFGDFRDNVLLEFETRIFNNLKIVSEIPLSQDEVIPGQFRTTDYSLADVNEILAPDFLSWIGWNKLDYTTQAYLSSDPFTYNYSQSQNKLSKQPLLGAWRGIYQYFYDTVAPATRPWEMLGFSQEPSWWQDYYGPAPYTSGNLVLWDDLANGIVRDPNGDYVLPQYRRPGLTEVLPVGSEGELLPPLDSVTGNFDSTSFRRSWTFGDGGPTEYTWRASSAWPFAAMRLLALTRPAEFLSLFADRDRYVFNEGIDQYLWDDRYRLDAKQLSPLYGDGNSKASYINWIIDYNRQLGVNSTVTLEQSLNNIGVRLCWRVGGFTDKKLLKITTERSTPNSQNAGLLLPDESYQILVYKNQPFEQTIYSSVVVQSTETGWQVYGYSTTTPYFEIFASIPNGNLQLITVGETTARISIDHSENVVQVPYGYTFTNVNAVCDFLYSYGLYLEHQGFVFENRENGYIMTWFQMCQEFLYWSEQGWGPGSIINLNPGATRVSLEKPLAVADSLAQLRPENLVLNQNRQPLPAGDLIIERLDNRFSATSLTNNTINYLNVSFTAYENIVILDNKSIFADLIYDPVTGARQSRILVSGAITGDWNGTLNAPGFVLNQENIQEWKPNSQYTKGQIVKFKNQYWAASKIIQPSNTFDYTVWLKSDYDEVMKGLLPNSPNASDQLINSYSVYSANLEREVDLFSYGLIGFRPREYMQALNLDDTSQVQLYQQFLGTKGTQQALEQFSLANLGKETAEYNIYEYWAMQRATYGATANRNYFEILLNEARLKSDPSIVEIIQSQQVSQADQTVLLSNLWKTSEKFNSTQIMPTVTLPASDAVLPSAGYVNFNDVDYSAFEIRAATQEELSTLGIGDTVWIAKVNDYDWTVYRLETVNGYVSQVSDNLDGNSLVQFSQQHGLAVNDVLVIRFFDAAVDGAYRVKAVPSLTTVLIELAFTGFQTSVTGEGVAFTLQNSRVAQASDIKNLPFAQTLTSGSKVWVDDNGSGKWEVVQKIDPFEVSQSVTPAIQQEFSLFGYSVAQGFNNLAAMVGAPGYNGSTGAVYTYVKDSNNNYVESSLLTLSGTTGATGFGTSMEIGDQTWAVIGAPTSLSNRGYALIIFNPVSSNAFERYQLLVPSPDGDTGDGEFGFSVAVSQNERWMYIGSPGNNKVYAYGRVDVQAQTVSYVASGVTNTFNYSDHIIVDDPSQLVVNVNGNPQTLGVDYNANSNNITFLVAPTAGIDVIITRRPGFSGAVGTSHQADGITDDFEFTSVVNLTADNQLVVKKNGVIQTLTTDYTVVRDGYVATITFVSTPADGDQIDIIQQRYDLAEIYSAVDLGSITVYINDQILRPKFDYDFESDSSFDLVLDDLPAVTDGIQLRALTYWKLVDVITVDGLAENARFGHSVSTTTDGRQVLIGAPNVADNSGRVYVFGRSVQRFQVDSTSETSFTTVRSLAVPGNPITVIYNGQYLVPEDGNIDSQYSVAGNTVTLDIDVSVGDIVEIETNQFDLVQTISDSNPLANQQFGWASDLCINNCSFYVGAPFDSSILLEAGHVDYNVNQSRLYGTTGDTVINPTLTSGHYLSVNNYMVPVPTPTTWGSGPEYTIDDLVTDGTSIYRALIDVPSGVDITDTTYWQAINWPTAMKMGVNNFGVPNVIATTTGDLEFTSNGFQVEYYIGSLWSGATAYTPLVYVNNVKQIFNVNYTYDETTQIITFNAAPEFNAQVRVLGARLTLGVKNFESAPRFGKLLVGPGTGNVFTDLGFNTYVHIQTVTSPVPQNFAHFGKAVFINDLATTLVVGAPEATAINFTTFDNNTTVFDSTSTKFSDAINQSGAVYTFDILPSANPSVTNPAQLVFGQQMYDRTVSPQDRFGQSVDYTTGVLLIGSPGEDFGDSQANYGRFVEFDNLDRRPAWSAIRTQQPVVNTELLNTIFMYDRVASNTKQYFDFFDPLQGKLLGAVRQNLDYIGAVDPAAYNVGPLNNYGQRWGQQRVGQIWWDTSNVRFIDPNQDDIVYASRRWGQVFPGSSIDVYQWVSSTVPPVQYAGPGTVKDTESYVVTSTVDEQGLFGTTYYFWVKDIRTVDRVAKKTLSIETLARYIEDPKSSGIAYVAPLNASTVAIYNGLEYIQAQDTVLHVEFDETLNEDAIHVEYQLIPQGRADGFLIDTLYRKLQDSFCGVDTQGNLVPDPMLPPSELYGVQFRPRQSMFANRFLALQNYLQRANAIVAQFPISETRVFPLLRSQDPEPSASSGAWDKRVANYEELTYQDLAAVDYGYKYLVVTDSTNNGLWTIYEVVAGPLVGSRELALIRVQNYDTNQYWDYIDWYRPGYNRFSLIVQEVPNASSLEAITVANGSSVKVTANGQGKWEIYLREDDAWTRVGLEDGTIEISAEIWDYALGRFGFDVEVFDAQYFDQEPVIETRKIIQSLNEEIFVDDLAVERNNLLVLMFNYILSEQTAPIWLTKTSLIDVDHVIRELEPFQIYRQDNQDFVLNYIQEVKPYHTQIREFNLIYRGKDVYDGVVNDFDVPAYWDPNVNLFISPVLDNDTEDPMSTTSSRPSTDPIWQTLPWNLWYQNYLLSIESVTVVEGGTGYTVPPEVVVTGDSEEPAEMIARINSAGRVVAVDVINPGRGYLTTATITLVGGNGQGATAVANMGNGKTRSFLTTIKYDRYTYSSDIVDWEPNVLYENGTRVRYIDKVWQADTPDSTPVQGAIFDPSEWTIVPAGDLTGIDRTQGYYAPTINMPGRDLALVISGIDYPGVQVDAPDYNQNTGFDVGNYDINPFDNISYGPEGLPTYDPAILDAIYESNFADPYLGTLPAPAYGGNPPNTGPNPIIVDGGEFVDTYESHAPEELVPGIIYDTLDMRVFTTPGSDWVGDGHGFDVEVKSFEFDSSNPVLNCQGLCEFPVAVQIYNQSVGAQLIPDEDYTVDYVTQLATILNGANNGDILVAKTYELGGGNQMYRYGYIGNTIGSTVIVPVAYNLIDDFAVFVNGVLVDNYTWSSNSTTTTQLTFTAPWTINDYVVVTAFGYTDVTPNYSWSIPVTQYAISDGSTLAFDLTNALTGTNPADIVVERNGVRARPPEGVEYISDGSSTTFDLPTRGGYSQGLISDNEVSVYIDTQPLANGSDFIVDPWDGSSNRTVTLAVPPAPGAVVYISVSTQADYYLNGSTLIWRASSSLVPLFGDTLSFTTWNDTRQQRLLTQVFVGPTTRGAFIGEGYDTTTYDEGNVTGQPDSFDYGTGTVIQNNIFDTGREIANPSRLLVTLNGQWLFPGEDFVINGTAVELLGPPINALDVVAITSVTQSEVPGAIGFRIFQDMRGLQTEYRITENSTTELVQTLQFDSDTIYVKDASRLGEPNLEQGIFGLITINGERISYRTRDLVNNTISGLRRGTAGTGAATHLVGSPVYDIGIGNLLPLEYQNRIVKTDAYGDGSQTVFTAPNINLSFGAIEPYDTTPYDSGDVNFGPGSFAFGENIPEEFLRVYVGGELQVGNWTLLSYDTVEVQFNYPPPAGVEVSLQVLRGQSWYEPGTGGDASNGIPLQEQMTDAARFIRGSFVRPV